MFEDVDVVLFCVSLIDYDEFSEDKNGVLINKMIASRQLFERTATHPTFEEKKFLLILNKFDLLEEKIEQVPLTQCEWFDDFNPVIGYNPNSSSSTNPSLARRASQYIAVKFKRLFRDLTDRKLFVSLATGLEPDNVDEAFNRDLKPENILVREDGHIMLTDFDLSLRCSVSPTLLRSSTDSEPVKMSGPCTESSCIEPLCIEPSCQVPCFSPSFLPAAAKARKLKAEVAAQVRSLPQLVAEPTDARSNSFVGTHEYLAPEIIKGEGHGAAVDWWTFGVFLYELLYGITPFKGSGNEETLANVVSESLKFPDSPLVSFQARDLIRELLVKEPENRLGTHKGATEIKQHPFFEGLNWALIRCAIPPEVPELYDFGVSKHGQNTQYLECKATGELLEFELF